MLRRAPSVGGGYRRWWGGGGEAGACTESLGSESGDVGCDAAEIDHFFPPPVPAPPGGGPEVDADAAAADEEDDDVGAEEEATEKRRRGGGLFPPVMPRASGPLVLRAERTGGRLILTEVRADEHARRGVFRAERHGGRLRLRFANDDDEPEAGGGGISGAGGVVPEALQHGCGGGGVELCQVAAGAAAGQRGVEVGAVMMGTT